LRQNQHYTEKNGFITATKLGTTNNLSVAETKNFTAATKRFVDRTKHFILTKYFCYAYFNILFCWYNKIFYSVTLFSLRGLKTKTALSRSFPRYNILR